MSQRVLVTAPHPDDETLGCGGTILRHAAAGDQVSWLICTEMKLEFGYPAEAITRRRLEIEQVAEQYGFAEVIELQWPTTRLDTLPKQELVKEAAAVVWRLQPEIMYLPFRGDVHSDHRLVFDVMAACTKWFRCHTIRRVLTYETPSETGFGLDPSSSAFCPNVFVDIAPYLDQKLKIMNLYDGEMDAFPFPRSEKTLRALAAWRGSYAGFAAGESFILLKELI